MIEPLSGRAEPCASRARYGAPAIICLLLVCAAWLGNGLYALGPPGGLLKTWSPAIVASAMIGFLLLHGLLSSGWRPVLLFIASVVLVGWTAESLSILTGFPFGNYRYAPSMGPFIGDVPVAVLAAYCAMGYVSWSMARILLRRVDGAIDASLLVSGPLLAAALMVIWDISMDPLRATAEGRWIWVGHGLHYGVPLSNFFGWFGVTWTMFQLYAWLASRSAGAARPAPIATRPTFWYAAPLMYLSFAVEYIGNPVMFRGDSLELRQLYEGVALISALTMLPAALLTASRVRVAVTETGAEAGAAR